MRMILTWLANTTTDIVFEILQVAQGVRAIYEKGITKLFKRLNKAIKYVPDHKASFRTPKFHCSSLKITE